MAVTQAHRLLSLTTPAGEDVLLLQALQGQEGISTLFHFDLELLSENDAIAFDTIVGQPVTIRLLLSAERERYIHGFVSRFAQSGNDERFTYYHAEVVPWLWFLTRTTDCRIFQDRSVPDILKAIFEEHGFSDFREAFTRTYTKLDYCVQYRETDFNFISRLIEQEGIYYFFEHERGKHTLVLADAPEAHKPCPEQPRVRYLPAGEAEEGEDVVTTWRMEQELRPGKYALRDFHEQMPAKVLEAVEPGTVKVGHNGQLEIYDYPGEYAQRFNQPDRRLGEVEPEGRTLVKLRMQEEEATHLLIHGGSHCRAWTSGYRFELTQHPRRDVNGAYVLATVYHTVVQSPDYISGVEVGQPYHNSFTCIPHRTPFRPPRVTPKPVVQGPQTAIVVGPANEEIYTDKYGRVKVQFHWDREGQHDENSSCWMRVSHPSAGKNWGSVSIPRIGQEVIVDFLEGDPDQPIITGRVYNAEQMPPYGLPGEGMVSGIKSNTTPGGGGYNEMSVNDTKGKEQVTVHAQYDMATTIEHDETHTVKTGNRTLKVETGTHNETIKGDTSITIETGAYTLKVAANKATTTVANEIVTTSQGAHIYLTAATEIKLEVGASKLLMKSNGDIELSGINVAINGAAKVRIHGAEVTSEADAQHQIKGAIVISEGSATNTVKGGMVMLNP